MDDWAVISVSDGHCIGVYPTLEAAQWIAGRYNDMRPYWGGWTDARGPQYIVAKGEPCDPNLYGPDPV